MQMSIAVCKPLHVLPFLMAMQELPTIQQQIDLSVATCEVLESSQTQLTDAAADLFWNLRAWPNLVMHELAAAKQSISVYRNHYQLQLQQDQQQLQQELQRFKVLFQGL